jgi:hypothetical protein
LILSAYFGLIVHWESGRAVSGSPVSLQAARQAVHVPMPESREDLKDTGKERKNFHGPNGTGFALRRRGRGRAQGMLPGKDQKSQAGNEAVRNDG